MSEHPLVRVDAVVVGPFQSNCYVVWDDATKDCVVIDPGDEVPRIAGVLDAYRLKPQAALLTHGHLDHAGGLNAFIERFAVPFRLHREDAPLLASIREQGAMFGIFTGEPPVPQDFLADGDALALGSLAFEALHTPGHTPGSLCFRLADRLFTGDLLFAGSVGRTDLPGGSPALLQRSLERVLALPPGTTVFPGHGPATTLEREARSNPYLSGGLLTI
jgi:glyoxylase-like metal-dependent hydrolase (beta-lactamase superfamily II)